MIEKARIKLMELEKEFTSNKTVYGMICYSIVACELTNLDYIDMENIGEHDKLRLTEVINGSYVEHIYKEIIKDKDNINFVNYNGFIDQILIDTISSNVYRSVKNDKN